MLPSEPRAADGPDERYMRLALRLGARGLGQTWPNPAVGCVIVNAGRIVGRGWTQPGGRPHAEVHALAHAGPAAFDATVYVTLEPCAHYGRTAPCTQALLRAGVHRVVLGARDPDPRVDGKGIKQLRQARVQVLTGTLEAECEAAHAGFFLRVREGRPLVTLKLATSLDARIATASGDSQWITNARAREVGHGLRASHDAIAVGSNTVLADDPSLTCRLPGMAGRSPVAVVFDSRARLPLSSRLVSHVEDRPVWLLCTDRASAERQAALSAAGVEILSVPPDDQDRVDVGAALKALGERGLTRLLVEGGGALAAALLGADRVDRIEAFTAPMVLGGDAKPAIGALQLGELAQARRFVPEQRASLQTDGWVTYIRVPR